jgi:hypothetical protein
LNAKLKNHEPAFWAIQLRGFTLTSSSSKKMERKAKGINLKNGKDLKKLKQDA